MRMLKAADYSPNKQRQRPRGGVAKERILRAAFRRNQLGKKVQQAGEIGFLGIEAGRLGRYGFGPQRGKAGMFQKRVASRVGNQQTWHGAHQPSDGRSANLHQAIFYPVEAIVCLAIVVSQQQQLRGHAGIAPGDFRAAGQINHGAIEQQLHLRKGLRKRRKKGQILKLRFRAARNKPMRASFFRARGALVQILLEARPHDPAVISARGAGWVRSGLQRGSSDKWERSSFESQRLTSRRSTPLPSGTEYPSRAGGPGAGSKDAGSRPQSASRRR